MGHPCTMGRTGPVTALKSTSASREAASAAATAKAERLVQYVLARLATAPPLQPAIGPAAWLALPDLKSSIPCEATRPHPPQGNHE